TYYSLTPLRSRELGCAMRTTCSLDRNRHRARRTIFHYLRTSLGLFELVDPFDDEKDAKGNDHEIDRNGDEIAVGEDRSQFFCFRERQSRRDLIGQGDVEIAEIKIANDSADRRHQQVFDDRSNNFSKGCADNDADGEINGVAFDGEFLELL